MLDTRKKTVAFINHSAGLAGAEQVLYLTLESLPRELYRPVVFFPEEGPLINKIEALGIETRRYSNVYQHSIVKPDTFLQRNQNVWKDFSERVSSLSKELKDVGSNMVYTNTIIPVEGAFAAAHLGLPHIWHIHELFLDNTFFNWIIGVPSFATLVGMLSDHIISGSNSCNYQISPYVFSEKHSCVYAPIKWDIYQRSLPIPDDLREDRNNKSIIIGCIGTICERKAQTDFLDALELIPEHILSTCAIWLVGEPISKEAEVNITERINKLPPHIALRWLGHRDDIPALLKAIDFLVHPAINEPLGMVLIEAMASGKPVVATKTGGIVETVIDNVTGKLVPIRDSQSLAEAITEMIRDGKKREKMGEMAIEHVRKYDIVNFNRKIHTILNDTLKSKLDVFSRQKYVDAFETNIKLLINQPPKPGQPGNSFLDVFRRAFKWM